MRVLSMRNIMRPVFVLTLCFVAPTAWPAPACTTATPACTEFVAVGPAPGRSLVYRTHPLDARNESITRALVMVHGQGRNADGYFSTAVAAAFVAGALEDTIVVSPRFASSEGTCRDSLAPQELSWVCAGPESWRTGGGRRFRGRSFVHDIRRVALWHAEPRRPRREALERAAHQTGGRSADRVHDRRARHLPALRLRLLVSRDGPGSDAACARSRIR